MAFEIIDHRRDNVKTAETEEEAEERRNNIIGLGANPEDIEIRPKPSTDGGTMEVQEPPPKEGEPAQNPPKDDIDALVENPIDWLRSVNEDYVNVVKGTPAISKRGFRFIQSKFEISTQSELVEVVEDPLGVIVWAKAELPDGRSAEAHGEGWKSESSVDDNEFVRYADTRAKNRALADLTSSGALATEELK